MFCQKCGTENKDDASFCSKCRNELKSTKVETERKGIMGKLGKMGIPGFRSGKSWKMGLAFVGYFFIFMIFLAIISPNNSDTNAPLASQKSELSSTSGNVQQTIPETYSDIYHKLQECGTVIQCDDWVNSYLNKKKVRWNGTVVDANSEKAIVNVILIGDEQRESDSNGTVIRVIAPGTVSRRVYLFDISSVDLLKINKGQNITFIGQLKIDVDSFREHQSGLGQMSWSQAWDGRSPVNLYEVEIQNT